MIILRCLLFCQLQLSKLERTKLFVERASLIFLGLFTHISKLATFNVVLMTNEGSPSESTTLTLSVKKCLRDNDYRKWVSNVMDSNISQFAKSKAWPVIE